MNATTVEQIVEVVRLLPEEKAAEVLDFAQFLLLRSGSDEDRANAFYAWAEDLARSHGFDHLTEEDVAQIVHQSRQEKSVS